MTSRLPHRAGRALAFLRAAAFALPAAGVVAHAEDKVSFNREVRPILANCFSCHGPDEKKREAKLRLDLRDSALAERDGVRALVPGRPDKSELLARVQSHDRDELMPPPKSKKPPLNSTEISTLRKWVEQGAEYEGHWAFLPLSTAEPPAVENREWAQNPIDQFIVARLEIEGLTPSPEADAATLCRRLYLDLIGLLPSPEEVRNFVQEASTNQSPAVEKLVDALLANPHYGERWGRHWLDQARYADSNGYTIDSDRAMWPYRDWVIAALNADLPFDRFTIEQLAGDLLPNPTKSQIVATAFHRNTLINEEGGTDKEQFRNEAAVDRVNTTGAVWLGLTVGCAQCHTHKFDPIPHREYYELFAFFNQGTDVNNRGETIPVARGEMFGAPGAGRGDPDRAARDAEIARLQAEWERAELARFDTSLTAAPPPKPAPQWAPAKYLAYDTKAGAGFRLQPDNSLLADGGGAANDTYRVVAQTSLKQIAAVRLRVLPHDSLPQKGPGLAKNGNFVLTEFTASVGGTEQAIATAFADHEQANFPVSAAIDDKPQTGWGINVAKGSAVKMHAEHEAVFVFAKPIVVDEEPIELLLHHDVNQNYLIGCFAVEFADTAPSGLANPNEALVAALKVPPSERTEPMLQVVRDAFERAEPKAREAKKKNSDEAELMVMKETDQPRPTYIHIRGDFLRNDERTGPLTPGVLSSVPPTLPPSPQRTRLDLARWLVSPDNPLTPRVTINRMWMRYFGRGLVETDDDFGTQGSPPTHPELLDWLAGEFIRQGWSMKAMHRLIATSATYRQSSRTRQDLTAKDPRNLLLARQERVRVEGEIVRDAMLSASGLLDPAIGGPSVHPPQPDGVYAFTQNVKKWTADTDANRYRRALYTTFYRSAPYPLFTTFDAPDFQTVCTRRPRSDTPLQALTVANNTAFLELARGLATRVLREVPGDDTDARLQRAFVLCLGREPSAKELSTLRDYHARHRAAGADEAAAITAVARTLFNTDNFITRE